ncbi:hypothetical protein D3C84_1269980 [compost metagenome]
MPSAATTTLSVVNPVTTAFPVLTGTPYTAMFFVWSTNVVRSITPFVEFQALPATKRSASRLACSNTLY